MNKKQRQKQIVDYINTVSEASIQELVQLTDSSIATIRRDLLDLHEQNLLIRLPGGARNMVQQQSLVQRTFDQRRSHNAEAKLAIATAAKKLVQPGMTIAIDSGTTCWQFAAQLVDIKPLRILTSAVAVIETLGDCDGIELVVIGGLFRQSNLDFTGPSTINSFRQFSADIAFLGCDGFIPEKGIFTNDLDSHAISQAIAACAEKRVILFDDHKLNVRHSCRILEPREIDCIITNAQINTPLPGNLEYICTSAE